MQMLTGVLQKSFQAELEINVLIHLEANAQNTH